MKGIAVVAYGAISGLGEGPDAASAGRVGDRAAIAIRKDDELVRAGLARPFVARARRRHVEDGAVELLEQAMSACAAELDRLRPQWRDERVGLVLGTSAGGMCAAERAFSAIAAGRPVRDAEALTYGGPAARVARTLGRSFDPTMLVLGACASSALALGLAARWLERGSCDLVLAGGFDEVTVFVAAGFEALRATTASPPPRPFRLGRDGMALGEGAAVLALARSSASSALAYVQGFGAASDAVHLTGPDRGGRGLARAAALALDDAGSPRVDLVSAHATATPFNDAAESRAIALALGSEVAREVVVHPFKAQAGHTLGAAGALELIAAIDGMTRGVFSASAGDGTPDPDAPARLLDRATAGSPRCVLKLASAFGGANAALVVGCDPAGTARPRGAAFVHGAVVIEEEPPLEVLADMLGTSMDRLARTDGLVRLALAAVAKLTQIEVSLAGAGVVIGSAQATIETNAVFAARIRDRGARAAEPRRFPYTSPNAVAGECSIAFGMTGPSFSMGGGPQAGLEAIAAGTLLVEAGDVPRVVVVAVDEVGPITRALLGASHRAGAVACLVSADSRGARARVGEIALRRGAPVEVAEGHGHVALRRLGAPGVPREMTCSAPPDFFARVVLDPV
jgi:3-oxoacyl-[acyl-carrier-protein] synthase-1/3-oxoacyl-[acyl-carrier-protein] synthase II